MDKTIKLLEEFLSSYEMEGICGTWVDNELDEDGNYWVYIVLDLNWLEENQTKPGFIEQRMKQGLKEEIKKYLNLDVYVGSTAKKCGSLNESVSTYLRRRLSFQDMKENMENVVDYELNPCEFSNIGDFVAEACDMLAHNYLEDLQVSSKDKDNFYFALVDLFGEYLSKVYKQRCVNGLNESKKRIIVTESQYKRLFEQKVSKIEMFQDLINDKLNYFKTHCDDVNSESFPNDIGFSSCDSIELVESVKVDEVQKMTGARTDMYGNMYDATPSIYVKLTIDYWSIKGSHDFDDLIYDLKHILRNSTGGLPIVFDYRTKNISKIKE
jgi:Zn-dependent M32 family carboxypeptidase